MGKIIEIPYGANDSELKGWEYTIPEGMEAVIENGKVIVRQKECEDERIRKSLVKYFRQFNLEDMWDEEFSFNDILTYLEKQKEQKPVTIVRIPKFRVGDIVTNGDDVYTIDHIGSDCYWLKEHDCATIPFEYEDKWRIVEQKPAEWSEEDEEIYRIIINRLTKFDEWASKQGYTRDDPSLQRNPKEWLKSLRPQPKAELDVVAEKEAYKDGFLTARYNSANAFMQYLDEHRPEWKMCLSNWEREDINKAFEVGDWAKIIRYINKYQPHWRPSEEHMEALKRFIGPSPTGMVLADLYDKLEKLK